jgi:putative transposase
MAEWQSRPLDAVYPVMLIDAIFVKIRDGSVANRPICVAMEINVEGQRDVLGMWVGPSGGEGAKVWMGMLTGSRNRGVRDVCIACCDGLKGLPDASTATWPQATVQTCVVHLVRNRSSPSVWATKYPAMVAAWERACPEFVPFLAFPRRDPQADLHDQRHREPQRPVPKGGAPARHFPNDQAARRNPSSTHSPSTTATGSPPIDHHAAYTKFRTVPRCAAAGRCCGSPVLGRGRWP